MCLGLQHKKEGSRYAKLFTNCSILIDGGIKPM